jgi:hypothetical protein
MKYVIYKSSNLHIILPIIELMITTITSIISAFALPTGDNSFTFYTQK